jgi:hypothetical protein
MSYLRYLYLLAHSGVQLFLSRPFSLLTWLSNRLTYYIECTCNVIPEKRGVHFNKR